MNPCCRTFFPPSQSVSHSMALPQNSPTLFSAQFPTWSKWRQRRWWHDDLKVTKQKRRQCFGIKKRAETKAEEEKPVERIVGSMSLYTMKSLTHWYVNTKFHLKNAQFIPSTSKLLFIVFIIMCAIRLGCLISFFLFRRKMRQKCVYLVFERFHFAVLWNSSLQINMFLCFVDVVLVAWCFFFFLVHRKRKRIRVRWKRYDKKWLW